MKKLLFAGIALTLLSFAFTSKTDRTITGTIRDQNGDLIPFATIKLITKNKSFTADANAGFAIVIDDRIRSLEVSAVGFKTIEVQVTKATHYNIVMERIAANITDVVVTTGLARQHAPLANGYSNLQGAVAGV